jgi:plastocyanin
MHRRQFLATLATGAGVGLAGCGIGGGNPTGGDYDIGMGASVFEPRELTISVGETVRWRNTNSRAHTVTAYEARIPNVAGYWASGGFETELAARDGFYNSFAGALSSEDTYEQTFRTTGQHHYFCVPHERAGMVGVVEVER